MRTGVEPSEAASEDLHLELSVGEKPLVHRGDLQLPAGGGLDRFGHGDHPVRVEVQSHYGVIGFRMFGLLFDREACPLLVELGHAVPLGIVYPVSENGRLALLLGRADGLPQLSGKAHPLKDVVAQNEAYGLVPDELLSDQKRLSEPVGRRLLGIGETDPVVGPVSEQPPERGQVPRRGDHQNVPDSGQHQNRQRIVDHRLVVDRQQLLGNPLGDRVQTRPRSPGQYDTFHRMIK